MKPKTAQASAALASFLAPVAASAADEVPVLQPVSAWEMSYDDDSCALRRMFGEPGHQVFFEMRRFSPDKGMQIAVMTERAERGPDTLKYRFGIADEWKTTTASLYARLGDLEGFIFPGTVLPQTPPSETPEARVDPEYPLVLSRAFRNASSFSVSGGFKQSFTLDTGPMLAPHRAMEKCVDEMLKRWGIDTEAHKTLTRRAVPRDMQGLARRLQQDYPAAMLRKGTPGLIRYRLGVSADGDVTDCHIQLDISDVEFERSACRHLKGAQFEPATAKDGQPIASYWVSSITYEVH